MTQAFILLGDRAGGAPVGQVAQGGLPAHGQGLVEALVDNAPGRRERRGDGADGLTLGIAAEDLGPAHDPLGSGVGVGQLLQLGLFFGPKDQLSSSRESRHPAAVKRPACRVNHSFPIQRTDVLDTLQRSVPRRSPPIAHASARVPPRADRNRTGAVRSAEASGQPAAGGGLENARRPHTANERAGVPTTCGAHADKPARMPRAFSVSGTTTTAAILWDACSSPALCKPRCSIKRHATP
jgi:hypothetical protein